MNKKTYSKILTQVKRIQAVKAASFDSEEFARCVLKIREAFEDAVGRGAVAATAKLLGVPTVQVYQWCDASHSPRTKTACTIVKRLNKKDRVINTTFGV